MELSEERQDEWVTAFGNGISPSAAVRAEAAAQLAALVAELENGEDASGPSGAVEHEER